MPMKQVRPVLRWTYSNCRWSYGTNGFANSLESNDTKDASINYATTAYMAYSPVSACADTDNDGYPDIADIDDDNDGILDYEELACGVSTFVKSYVIKKGLSLSHGGSFNNGNAKGTAGVTDNSESSNFLVDDANGAYSMKASISPTNGLLSLISFGPNLPGNSANAAILNAAQSITVSWNLPIGAVVHDPDNQLSSHADGDAINPGGVLITRQAYTVSASTWKVVLPLPYLNSDVLFSIDFNSETNFDEESFEAKSGRVLTDVTIAGPYGENGLSSLVESDDTQFATTNYTTLPNYLDENVRGCLDTDGDGVANIDDLDDDNDGILDQCHWPLGRWLDKSSVDRVMTITFEPVAPYTSLALKVLATEGGNGALSSSTNKVFISVLYGAVATVENPLVLTYTWNALAGTVGNENFGFQLMDMNPSFGSGPCDTDGDGFQMTLTMILTTMVARMLTKNIILLMHKPVDQEATVGGTATFSSTVTSGSGTTTYKWQITTDGGANWTDIDGTTTTVTTPDTSSTLSYTVSYHSGYGFLQL
ncbi:hypothetical protein GHT06_003728 [Daphnia sinensis]|uniref:Uncharacterized protein n=1 Tax=Daphnia sinensis TaxID=1820382 RepID=A0AAD5PKL3_9CRUS|nr:hypothetical protein GHT06_003728 [Daphnia sinensis]